MFIRLRMMAHEVLREYMHGEHNLSDDTTRRIYDTIKTAETNEAFANSLDWECSKAFNGQTAEGYDDLVNLFDCIDDAPEDLQDLLKRYNIIKEDL